MRLNWLRLDGGHLEEFLIWDECVNFEVENLMWEKEKDFLWRRIVLMIVIVFNFLLGITCYFKFCFKWLQICYWFKYGFKYMFLFGYFLDFSSLLS
jgi:hypothetical protein